METSYVAGGGVLLTRGRRWLLVDDDPPAKQLDEWWDLMGATGPVGERLLSSLEIAYPTRNVSLVLVDLHDPELAVTWGAGRIEAGSEGRRLTVGLDSDGRPRRLIAGVVPAAAAEFHAAEPDEPSPTAEAPAGILGHSAADPPGSQPALQPPDVPSARAEEADDLEMTVPRKVSDLLGGVLEPDQGHAQVYSEDLGGHLRQAALDTVLAVRCPDGHLSTPFAPTCRFCGAEIPMQEATTVPRPTLGGLRLPTGELIPLDRGVVFGRRPAPLPGAREAPHLVHLPMDSTYVSRMHLQIELDGWLVLARDLGSRGGTTLRIPDRLPQRIRADERYVIEPGYTLDLADVYEITYEVIVEATR